MAPTVELEGVKGVGATSWAVTWVKIITVGGVPYSIVSYSDFKDEVLLREMY